MKIFSISPARQNIISKIVYPKKEVRIPVMSDTALYDKLLGEQDYLNSLATKYRVGFSFTQVPIYNGCIVYCWKGSTFKPSDYITANDSDADIQRKLTETVYKIVPKK